MSTEKIERAISELDPDILEPMLKMRADLHGGRADDRPSRGAEDVSKTGGRAEADRIRIDMRVVALIAAVFLTVIAVAALPLLIKPDPGKAEALPSYDQLVKNAQIVPGPDEAVLNSFEDIIELCRDNGTEVAAASGEVTGLRYYLNIDNEIGEILGGFTIADMNIIPAQGLNFSSLTFGGAAEVMSDCYLSFADEKDLLEYIGKVTGVRIESKEDLKKLAETTVELIPEKGYEYLMNIAENEIPFDLGETYSLLLRQTKDAIKDIPVSEYADRFYGMYVVPFAKELSGLGDHLRLNKTFVEHAESLRKTVRTAMSLSSASDALDYLTANREILQNDTETLLHEFLGSDLMKRYAELASGAPGYYDLYCSEVFRELINRDDFIRALDREARRLAEASFSDILQAARGIVCFIEQQRVIDRMYTAEGIQLWSSIREAVERIREYITTDRSYANKYIGLYGGQR